MPGDLGLGEGFVFSEFDVRPDRLKTPEKRGLASKALSISQLTSRVLVGGQGETVTLPSIGREPVITIVDRKELESLAQEYEIKTEGIESQQIVDTILRLVHDLDPAQMITGPTLTCTNRGQLAVIVNGLRAAGAQLADPAVFTTWFAEKLHSSPPFTIPVDELLSHFQWPPTWPPLRESTPKIVHKLFEMAQQPFLDPVKEELSSAQLFLPQPGYYDSETLSKVIIRANIGKLRRLKAVLSSSRNKENKIMQAILKQLTPTFSRIKQELEQIPKSLAVPEDVLERALLAAYVEQSEDLIIEIGGTPSQSGSVRDKIQENLEKLHEWRVATRSALSSISLTGFPQKEGELIRQREQLAFLKEERFPTVDEVKQAIRLVGVVNRWKEVIEKIGRQREAFRTLRERISTFSTVQDPLWASCIAAEDEIQSVIADADAHVESDPKYMRYLIEGVDSFAASVKKFENEIDKGIRERSQALKKNIKEMYQLLSPEEGGRAKLPYFGTWQRLQDQTEEAVTGQDLDSLLMKLQILEEEVKIPYELFLSTQKNEKGEQTNFAAQAASAMRIRGATKEIVRCIKECADEDEYSHKSQSFLEILFSEIQRFPSLADTAIPRLLTAFADTSPKTISEEAFLLSLTRGIVSPSSRADVIVPELQKQVALSQKPQLLQSLLDRLSNGLGTELNRALQSSDPGLLRGVLYRMILASHQSQGRTEEMVRLLGNALVQVDQRFMVTRVVSNLPLFSRWFPEDFVAKKGEEERFKKVASELSALFQWFPEESTELREGIRTLSKMLAMRELTPSLAYPKNVSAGLSKMIQALCSMVLEEHALQPSWDVGDFHTALVMNPSPDTVHDPEISMLERSRLSLSLGLERLQDEVGRSTPLHPIFFGTEWKFMAGSYQEFIRLLDSLSQISRSYPQVTFIPGSIGWFDPQTKLCFNSLPIFENGRLVSLYSKRHERADMTTIAEKNDQDWSELVWAATAVPEVFDDYFRNTSLLDNGVALGTEICNDHVNCALLEDYQQEFPGGSGVDIHLVMAHGTELNRSKVRARENGIVGYIDHSTNGETTVGKVSVQRGIYTEKKDCINSNIEALGAFVTYQTDVGEVAPVFSAKQDSIVANVLQSSTPSTILEALREGEALTVLIRYVKENTSHLFPSKQAISGVSFKTPEEIREGLTEALYRYTFADEADVNGFLKILENNEPIGRYRTPFFQCLASALGRPIVLYTDLCSEGRVVFMPDRSRPIGIPKNALEIGFSFERKVFFTPSWEESEEYVATQNGCIANLPLWKAQVNTIDEELRKTKQTNIENIKSLMKTIEEFRTSLKRGTITQQRAFIEYEDQIDALEGKLLGLLEMAEKASSLSDAVQEVFVKWAQGETANFAKVRSAREECPKEIQPQEGFPEEQCIEVFSTLEEFQRASSGFKGLVGMVGVWIEGETKKLTSGTVLLKQNTSGVAEELDHLRERMLPLFPLVSEQRRQQMVQCLHYLKAYYPADVLIARSVDGFIEQLKKTTQAA